MKVQVTANRWQGKGERRGLEQVNFKNSDGVCCCFRGTYFLDILKESLEFA